MIKFIICSLFMVVALAIPLEVQAGGIWRPLGDMSFFGGMSEGVRLPRTTEQMLIDQGNRRNRNDDIILRYSELVFLTGRPVRFDGTLEIDTNATLDMTPGNAATFNLTHTIEPSAATGDEVEIWREVTFTVDYNVAGSQVIFNYNAQRDNWEETILVDGVEFVLDPDVSHFNISIFEDRTPGVAYYRGDVSARLVYIRDGEDTVVKEIVGSFHGYRSVWSTTETHRLDISIDAGDWQMQYQIRPSLIQNKVLQFIHNEPTVISFEGNFREVLQTYTGLRYTIFTAPNFMWDVPREGVAHLETHNIFEQLPAPDLTFLRGNAAEDDIRRLFSTQILQGDPRFFQPSHAITRGQFVTAVTRAIRLPIEPVAPARGRRVQVDTAVFHDVPMHRPEFPYIMAAYRAGLAVGRANSMFYFDYPIDRQEAFMIMIRALGLTQMGLNPTPVTPFADDALIASWARREVTVAHMIGLAVPDDMGFFHPTRQLSMGEAANIINELVEYMRVGLISDYVDQIVNIAR